MKTTQECSAKAKQIIIDLHGWADNPANEFAVVGILNNTLVMTHMSAVSEQKDALMRACKQDENNKQR